jgi:proteasome accessory factor C
MAAETALQRIERLLQLLAFAAAVPDRDGIGYDELADQLEVDRDQLDRDLAEITAREFYMRGGEGGDIQIALETDRVRVWTAGHLRRPTRLSTGEAAALDLGLRILAAEREDPELPDRMRHLLEKLARALPDDVAERIAADGDPAAADSLRALIVDAARRRQRVRFEYLKADADAPEQRALDPYAVAYARGQWYAVGWCPEREAVRVFRLDRVLEATVPGDASFDEPADFDLGDYVADGRVYSGGSEFQVVVRYGGRVAPWLLERGDGEPLPDGGVVACHQVSDPGWIVRHVLQYGRDARVLEPEWVAEAVRGRVEEVMAGGGSHPSVADG